MGLMSFFTALIKKSQDSDTAGLAAEMAYHLMLALFPSLIFAISLVKFIGLQFNLLDDIFPFIFEMLPQALIPPVKDTLIQIIKDPNNTVAILGFIGFLWSASNGASALMKGIYRAYQVDAKTLSPVKDRLLSLWIIIVMATSLIGLFYLVLFGNGLIVWTANLFNLSQWATVTLQVFKILLILTGLLGVCNFIYTVSLSQLSPRITWRQTLPGTLTFVALWLLMSGGFTWYVENLGNYNRVYGSLGGAIILMVWLYLSAFMLLVGSGINALLMAKKV